MCLLGQPSGQYRGCIRLASFKNFVLHMSVARKTTICGGGGGGGGGYIPLFQPLFQIKFHFLLAFSNY